MEYSVIDTRGLGFESWMRLGLENRKIWFLGIFRPYESTHEGYESTHARFESIHEGFGSTHPVLF